MIICASLLPIHLTASVKRRGFICLLGQRQYDDDDDNSQNASGLFLDFKFPQISKQERMTLKLLLSKFWEQLT